MKVYRTPFRDNVLLSSTYRHRVRGIPPGQGDLILGALDQMAVIFDSAGDWVLGGGIAIALHAGRFYRSHYDIDVLIEKSSLPSFAARALECKYLAFRERSVLPIPFLTLFRLVRRIDFQSPDSSNFIKFFRFDSNPPWENEFLSLLDVTLLVHDGTHITRADGKVRTTRSGFGPVTYTTPSGSQIRLAGLEYLKEAKARRSASIDRLDSSVIDELLSRRSRL